MAAAIKEEFEVEPELIPGGGGIFDVKVGGKLIYSKHETGQFPENELILGKIAALSNA